MEDAWGMVIGILIFGFLCVLSAAGFIAHFFLKNEDTSKIDPYFLKDREDSIKLTRRIGVVGVLGAIMLLCHLVYQAYKG